jgi:hypothetical protein
MPSKSPEQERLMAAVAHNPTFAKKVGIPQDVGQEFNRADMAKGYVRALRRKRAQPPTPAY